MSNNRYIFVKKGEQCPEGTQTADLGLPDGYCRSDCTQGDCIGYPGVSLIKNNEKYDVRINSSNPWVIGNTYFQTTEDGCNLCKQNECSDGGYSGCCTGDSDTVKCKHINPGGYSYSTLKYKGSDCDKVCDKNEENCTWRSCNTSPLTKNYKCQNGQCVNVGSGNGDYSSSNCDGQCTSKDYDCMDGQCQYVGKNMGKYIDKMCEGDCHPSNLNISCINGKCEKVQDGQGQYSSIEECLDDFEGECYTDSSENSSNAVIITLSILAGIILLAIIGMFVYLFLNGKKNNTN